MFHTREPAYFIAKLAHAKAVPSSDRIDPNHPSQPVVEARCHMILDKLNEIFELKIPHQDYPRIAVSSSADGRSSLYLRENLIVINQSHLQDGLIYSEECMHWIRNACVKEPNRRFTECLVEEFFGRLGESIVAKAFVDHELSDFFKEQRAFLKDDIKVSYNIGVTLQTYSSILRQQDTKMQSAAEHYCIFELSHALGYQIAEHFAATNSDIVSACKELLTKNASELIDTLNPGAFMFAMLCSSFPEFAKALASEWGCDMGPSKAQVPEFLKRTRDAA